jgi:hypothetical protein
MENKPIIVVNTLKQDCMTISETPLLLTVLEQSSILTKDVATIFEKYFFENLYEHDFIFFVFDYMYWSKPLERNF